jgi:small subunit ribosomal protein S8
MNITDPISDMLTRIRNAGGAHHKMVRIPASNIKKDIAEILKKSGYIKDFSFVEDNKQGELEIKLKYDEYGDPVIRGLKRISKPGLREYVKKDSIPMVRYGYGTVILSTSKGVITGAEARKLGVGGEVLCHVW